MPKLIDHQQVDQDSNTNTCVGVAPLTYASVNDLAVWVCWINARGGVPTAPTGWTEISFTDNDSGQFTIRAYYRQLQSGDTAPTLTHSFNCTSMNTMFFFESGTFDSTTPIDGNADSVTTTASRTTPSVTPSENNCGLLSIVGTDNNLGPISDGNSRVLSIGHVTGLTYAYGYSCLPGTSATNSMDITCTGSDDGVSSSILIRDNSPTAPTHSWYVPNDESHVEHIAQMTDARFATGTGEVVRDPTLNGVTTINSTTVSYLSPGTEFDDGLFPYLETHELLGSSGSNYQGFELTLASAVDMSASDYKLGFHLVSGGPSSLFPSDSDGGFVMMLRSSDTGGPTYNWKAYKMYSSEGNVLGAFRGCYIIDVGSAGSYELDTSGTLDLADITHVGFYFKQVSAGGYTIRLTELMQLNPITVAGGYSTEAITIEDIYSQALTIPSLSAVKQGTGQYLFKQPVKIGADGHYVYFSDSAVSIEFPSATDVANGVVGANIGNNLLGITFNFEDSNGNPTINLTKSSITSSTDFYVHVKDLTTTPSNITADFDALLISGPGETEWDDLSVAHSGITFAGRDTFDYTAATMNGDFSGGCTFNNTQITVGGATAAAIQAQLDHIANCNLSASATAIRVEYTGTGNISLDFDNITWTGNTTDIHYNSTNSSSLTAVMENGSNATTSAISGSATGVTISAPSDDLTLTSSESGTLLQIFTTGTQTILDSTTGTSLVYTHSSETVDVAAQKAGFLPQRQTGIALSGDVSVTFNLVADPVYDVGHALTYTTDASWSRSNNELTVPTFGPSVRGVYSLMIDSFISETSLRNTAFNISMNGPNSMFLINDAEANADSSIENMTAGGVRYINTAGTATAEWLGVEDKGDGPGANIGEYQQQDGSGTTDARATGNFDEIIKVYGDASHGNFDYRSHLVLKYQVNGYREVRVDVPALYGVSTLEPTLYVVSMSPQAINAATGDPSLASPPSITDHGATPTTWQSKDWSITITDSAAGNSAEDILRWLNYNLRGANDTTFESKDPFNWPEMVVEEGSNYATTRGITEGAQSSTLKGIRVVENDGTTIHPGFARLQADDGTYYSPPENYSLTLSNLVAGSHVWVFNTGTTTILDSTTSSGTSFTYSGSYSSDQTVDFVIIQAGYIPIRGTSIVVSNTAIDLGQNMVEDRAYLASSGLSYGTTATVNTGTSEVAVTVATTVQNWYSFMVESWRDQSALLNVAFPFDTFGPDSYSLNDDWEWDGTSSINNLSRDGFRYVDSSDTVTAEWCAVLSIGTATGFTGEYQQVDGSGTTDALASGAFDQCIQTYGDASHGNFDYRDHLVMKFQPNGYRESRVDVLDTYGISALEPILYIVSMEPVAISAATGDPAISITVTDHGASPVTWNSKDFSITVVDNATNSGEDILRELNYNLSLDATYQGKDPFNWPEMVIESGSDYETLRGITEGGVGATLKGVRILRGGSEHPDFARFQADDGTYFTPATTAGVSAPSLTAGRVQLYNVTTATEVENTTITSGYSYNWIDGTDFTSGDTIRLRWTAIDSLPIETTGIATAAGTTTFLDTPEADTVYNTNGIDGTTITKFTADYTNDEIDVSTATNFTGPEIYAFYKDELTTTNGIDEFINGITAVDSGNYRINTATVDLYMDNITTNEVWQTDSSRVFRDDEARPVKHPTTGGGGIDMNWKNVVYVVTAGSGLTAGQQAELTEAAGSAASVFATVMEDTETFAESIKIMRAESAGKVAVSGNTVTFRDKADSKDRITATVDENGQRTSVTTDGS